MRTVRVDFNNGDHLVTSINGTEQSIREYYIGNQFNIGTGGDDLLVIATAVTFLPHPGPESPYGPTLLQDPL